MSQNLQIITPRINSVSSIKVINSIKQDLPILEPIQISKTTNQSTIKCYLPIITPYLHKIHLTFNNLTKTDPNQDKKVPKILNQNKVYQIKDQKGNFINSSNKRINYNLKAHLSWAEKPISKKDSKNKEFNTLELKVRNKSMKD